MPIGFGRENEEPEKWKRFAWRILDNQSIGFGMHVIPYDWHGDQPEASLYVDAFKWTLQCAMFWRMPRTRTKE